MIAKEKVLRPMYATKKQETVSVSKVLPDQTVVSAPLVFITTPSVLGVHAVLLVPLKMLVSLVIFTFFKLRFEKFGFSFLVYN